MTVKEFYIYLGIRIYIEVHRKNRIDFYQTNKPLFPTHLIKDLIGLRRFKFIYKLLRLNTDLAEE